MRDKQLKKLKAIYKIYKIMDKSKVSDADLRNMFSEEEITMIQDLKFIQKHYPKYFSEIENESN